MQVFIWSQFFWSLLAGMSFSLWCGLCPSKGFTLHTEFLHIWKGGYGNNTYYVLFPHLLFPTLLRACWAQQHTYNMKVQQQDSAAEGIRTNQPLDSPGARPRWAKSWRGFECDFISMWYLHKDPSNYFLFLKGSSRGGISPLSLDNMQPVFVVGFINSQIHLQQRLLI